MRFLLATLSTALSAALLLQFLPWWTISIAAAIVAMIFRLCSGRAFLMGFTAIFALWLAWYLVKDAGTEHLLSGRMAQVFSLNNPYLIMIVGAAVGGLVGGLGGLCGSLFRRAAQKHTRSVKTSRAQPVANQSL